MSASLRVSSQGSGAFGVAAERLRRAGDHQAAIDLCRQGLSRHPGHVGARVSLGLSLMATGHDEDAYAALKAALRLAPDNLAAIRGLAELHERGLGGEMVDPCMFDLSETASAATEPVFAPALEPTPAPVGPEPAIELAPVMPVGPRADIVEVLQPAWLEAPALAVEAATGIELDPVFVLGPVPEAESADVLTVADALPVEPPIATLDLAPEAVARGPLEDCDVAMAFRAPLATEAADPLDGLRLDDLDPDVPAAEAGVRIDGDFWLGDIPRAMDAPSVPARDEPDPPVPPSLGMSAMLAPIEPPPAALETVVPATQAAAVSTLPGIQASVFVQASIVVQGAATGANPVATSLTGVPAPAPLVASIALPSLADAAARPSAVGEAPRPVAPAAQVSVVAAVGVQSSSAVPVLPEGPAAILEEWLTRIHSRQRQILSEYAAS